MKIRTSLSRIRRRAPVRPSSAVATVLTLLLVGPLALADPARADRGWSLHAGGVRVDPDLDFREIDDEGDRVSVSGEAATGFSLGVGYRWSDRVGITLDLLSADPEIDATVASVEGAEILAASGDFSFEPLVLGMQFHLTPDRRADLWIGPSLAVVRYGDLTLEARAPGLPALEARFEAERDFAWGGEIGVDIGLGSGPWALTASALYLDTTLEITDEDGEHTDLDLDPLIARLGLRYRF